MLKTFRDKASKLSETGKSWSNKAKEKFDESGVSGLMLNKVKSINLEVIQQWTKDSDRPDSRSISEKLKDSAKQVGEELYVTVMQTYIALADPNTATKHKAILGAGLAYFVLPADIIPDFIVGVGFTDDIAALAITAKSVGDAIQDTHVDEAKAKWNKFAGTQKSSEVEENAIADPVEP